jgi:hypothetical protein
MCPEPSRVHPCEVGARLASQMFWYGLLPSRSLTALRQAAGRNGVEFS